MLNLMTGLRKDSNYRVDMTLMTVLRKDSNYRVDMTSSASIGKVMGCHIDLPEIQGTRSKEYNTYLNGCVGTPGDRNIPSSCITENRPKSVPILLWEVTEMRDWQVDKSSLTCGKTVLWHLLRIESHLALTTKTYSRRDPLAWSSPQMRNRVYWLANDILANWIIYLMFSIQLLQHCVIRNTWPVARDYIWRPLT